MQHDDEKWGAKAYAAVGIGVSLAGLGESAGFIGLSTTLALIPACIVVGVIGGLLWWGITRLAE
jgi:hypothetical protein